MRKDMGKVIVERPRIGSRNPNINTRMKFRGENIDYDEVDENIPTKKMGHRKLRAHQIGYDKKGFNEHLKPLKKFIIKNCGRPWDKVYSEIVEVCPTNSVLGRHVIYDHLFSYVDIHTFVGDDGGIYVNDDYGGPQINVKNKEAHRYGSVAYVNPKTGILTGYKKVPTRNYWKMTRDDEKDLDFIKISEGVHWIKENGTWFAHEYTFDPGTDLVERTVVHLYYVKLPDGTRGNTYHTVKKERRLLPGYQPWIWKGKRTLNKKEVKTILPENCGNYNHYKRVKTFLPSKDYIKK